MSAGPPCESVSSFFDAKIQAFSQNDRQVSSRLAKPKPCLRSLDICKKISPSQYHFHLIHCKLDSFADWRSIGRSTLNRPHHSVDSRTFPGTLIGYFCTCRTRLVEEQHDVKTVLFVFGSAFGNRDIASSGGGATTTERPWQPPLTLKPLCTLHRSDVSDACSIESALVNRSAHS